MEETVTKQLNNSSVPKQFVGKTFKPGTSGNPNGRPKMTKEEKIVKTVVKKAKQDVLEYLKGQGLGAASRIIKLSKKAKNENVRLGANKDVLDRIGVGIDKNNIGLAVQINVNSDKEQFA